MDHNAQGFEEVLDLQQRLWDFLALQGYVSSIHEVRNIFGFLPAV